MGFLGLMCRTILILWIDVFADLRSFAAEDARVQLYETTGGVFNAAAPAPSTVVVGTGTLTFQSCSGATLDYNFTGGSSAGASGAITLSRIGPLPQGCAP